MSVAVAEGVRRKLPPPPSPAPVIHPDAWYSKEQLQAMRFGERTLRSWRRAGMTCKYLGRLLFVQGSEVIRMIEKFGVDERWGSK